MQIDSSGDIDLLVVGSGAGGMAAAVSAALHGLSVLVIEKEPMLGGTTAWSGGWLWIPRNPLARATGTVEPPDAPRTYLRHELGNRFNAKLLDAFLEEGPRMVEFFENRTEVHFAPGVRVPDFHGETPGAVEGNRSVWPLPYDGRKLGATLSLLRPPLAEVSLAGMSIGQGADLAHFLRATRSLRSAAHVARRLARHAVDLIRFGRSTQLFNGNALAARLVKSAETAGVRIKVNAPARRLVVEDGRIAGAEVEEDGKIITIRARRGVVLASGGFPHGADEWRKLSDRSPVMKSHVSVAPASNVGDGLRLGVEVGAVIDEDVAEPAAWAPVSRVPYRNGSNGIFPHLIERAKPGVIAVTANGRRFVNEANSYYDFVVALLQATPPDAAPRSWLICDHQFLRRYGLGHVKPFPIPIGAHLRSGYLKRAQTLKALAAECGVDAAGLSATVAAYNVGARRGEDSEFGRGSTPFNRVQGDPHAPNPCNAPIEKAPFYAVEVFPGSLGTFMGLKSDALARALDASGRPIPGLYVVGNDMASVMAGHYPSGGITLGPAMTFGYIAGRHAAGAIENKDTSRTPENAKV